MSFVFTILGCGSSGGVPRLGQGWGACDPQNPKNRRRRCSLFVERVGPDGARTQVLVDTSPDLRAQLLDLGVTRLDAILMTHSHADHTHGIDDVRPLTIKARRRIDMHMDAETSAVVRHAFGYIFQAPPGSNYPALLNEVRLMPGSPCEVDGPGGQIEALPIRVHHGEIDALGFRFGDVAYTPDVAAIPDASVGHLENLDLWIIDALRYTPHPSHLSVEQALAWIERMKPRRAILTNLHTDIDFETLRASLPSHIQPAYDGMQVEVP